MNRSVKPRLRRQEIPNPQIRDAADQFESARRLLFAQPPGSGLLLPLMNASAIAIELYLKCLSAEKVYTDTGVDWFDVSAKHAVHNHNLTTLLDTAADDVKHELDRAFRANPVFAFRNLSLRDTLHQIEAVFEKSRYPFEQDNDLSEYSVDVVMACSHFLQQFVTRLPTKETFSNV